jgi:4-hydroxybenzoate polyprenyltransferase
MLCLQASIGAVNDLADIEVDRLGKPAKPIPAGLVTPAAARGWAAGSLALCLLLALASGLATVLVAVACVSLGYLYDVRLSRTVLSWLPLALALPLLPVFAWLGARADLPSGLLTLLPIAMLAGAALLVANGLVDVERDAAAGKPTVAVRLGWRRAWLAHLVVIVVAAILALQLAPAVPAVGNLGTGPTVTALRILRTIGLPIGVLALLAGAEIVSARRPGLRERGWELEAIGTAIIGLGWLAGTALVESGGAAS